MIITRRVEALRILLSGGILVLAAYSVMRLSGFADAVVLAPFYSIVVMLAHWYAVTRHTPYFSSFRSLTWALLLLFPQTALLFTGDCAIGIFNQPSHPLWVECIRDSDPGFTLTIGFAMLMLGILAYAYMYLIIGYLLAPTPTRT
jgi:hypothetical protein